MPDVSDRLPGHLCNAYCRDPIHADLSVGVSPGGLGEWQAIYGRYGARVLSVAPAERPPLVLPDGRAAPYYLVMVELVPLDAPGWYRPNP